MMKLEERADYQRVVRKFVKDLKTPGFLVSYGGGKTFNTLAWLSDRGQEMLPALWLTRRSILAQLPPEVERMTTFTCKIIEGNTPRQRIAALNSPADIYGLHYDGVRQKALFTALKKKGFKTIIVDESRAIKEKRTLRFARIHELGGLVENRAILDGRVTTEKIEELWAQLLFLDRGKRLGTSFWKFRQTYFNPGPPWAPYDWVLKPGAAKAIAAKISDICICVPPEVVKAQLPPKIYNPIYLEVPAQTRALMREFKKNYRITLPSGYKFETQWAMVLATKLHQMCQGFFTREDGSHEILDTTKVDWLQENIEDIVRTGPVLVWTYYNFAADMYAAACPLPCAVFSGSRPELQADAIDQFNSGKVDVLFLTEMAANAGCNLQRAKNAIFMMNAHQNGIRQNAEDRCHRIGSEVHDKVTYWDLLIQNSPDTTIYQALREKRDITKALMDALAAEGDW